MNPYYPFLELVFNHQKCTRFHLEHLEHGKHKAAFEECLKSGHITSCGKNENGDDLYCLTPSGKKIVDNPQG